MSCCGCQETPARVTNIFRHYELLLKFTELTGIDITGNTFICDLCTVKLETSHAFKEKCIEIHNISLLVDDDSTVEATEIIQVDEIIFSDQEDDENLYFYEEYVEDDATMRLEETEEFHLEEEINEPRVRSRKYRKISAVEKLEAIQCAEQSNTRNAAKYLSIDESCIRKWRKQKESIETLIETQLSEDPPEAENPPSSVLLDVERTMPERAKIRKSYTSREKLEVVKYAETDGNRSAARAHSIDESCIRKWRQQKELLIEIDKERGTRRKPNLHWPELDRRLKNWCEEKSSCGSRPKPSEIKSKSLEIARDLNIDNFRGTSSFIFKFMARYRFPGRPVNLKNLLKKKQ